MYGMLKNFFVSILILILLGISVFVGLTTFRSKEHYTDFDNVQRKYRLHLPRGYNNKTNYPLVIAFHGYSDNPRIMEIVTGLSMKADREGFIVLYPYGSKDRSLSPYSWNSEFCCGYAQEKNIDDIGYVRHLIGKLSEEYSVDVSRIYVTGYSSGGMMAHLVALKLNDKIAAVAPVGAAVGGKHEDDEEFKLLEKTFSPVPIILIHGKEDSSIPFAGGNGRDDVFEFTGAYDSLNFWLDNNKCTKRPSEISKTDHYAKEIYADCENSSEIIFYAVNTKHVWPGGLFELVKNISGRSVRATDLIWEFFAAHSK